MKKGTIEACYIGKKYQVATMRKVLPDEEIDQLARDVLYLKKEQAFIFQFGVVVAWDLPQKEFDELLIRLIPFIEEADESIRDSFSYQIQSNESYQQDKLILKDEKPITKLATVYAIAQSMKLERFERTIRQTIQETAPIVEEMKSKGSISLSRRKMIQKIGNLFMTKSSIELHIGTLSLPKIFWEHPEAEPVYNLASYYLDLKDRSESIKSQTELINDLFNILSHTLDQRHFIFMEWLVIGLIFAHFLFDIISKIWS